MLRLPFKPVKSQSFPQRLKIAELLLEKAARLYESGTPHTIYSAKWTEAIDQLEQSVSVFAEPPHPKKWEDSVPEDLALVRFSHDEARQIERKSPPKERSAHPLIRPAFPLLFRRPQRLRLRPYMRLLALPPTSKPLRPQTSSKGECSPSLA